MTLEHYVPGPDGHWKGSCKYNREQGLYQHSAYPEGKWVAVNSHDVDRWVHDKIWALVQPELLLQEGL